MPLSLSPSLLMSSASSVAFSPLSLFAAGEQGAWYDPSDLSTMFQDTAGTTPVTATGQTVGLLLDKSKGLVLGPELLASGAIGITGTATPATYNTSTGAGSVTRVDLSNQSFVQWSTLSANGLYRIAISCQTGAIIVRMGIFSGTQITSISAGQSATFYGNADGSGRITVTNTSSAGTSTFTVSSVKELPGNHATQATAASRPIYGIEPFGGRRNLLTYTEQFDNAAWSKVSVAVTANTAVAPDGTTTADTFTISSTGEVQQNATITSGATYTSTIYVKQAPTGSATHIRLSSNNAVAWNTGGSTKVALTSEWQRVTLTGTISGGATTWRTVIGTKDAGGNNDVDCVGNVLIWGAQLETGSTATAYQRVTDQWNVTQAGVPSVSYLAFDGTDDFLLTGTITPGIDKAQVFAGVRKLSDAGDQALLETSAGASFNNGAISLFAPVSGGANYNYGSRGTTFRGTTAATFTAPITNVVTGTSDISGDIAAIRVNGVQASPNTNDQGTGNYLAYPLYIGRRGGTSLPFNGRIYQMLVRFGANLSAATITQTETFVNSRTGAY